FSLSKADVHDVLNMNFLNEEFWYVSVDLQPEENSSIKYHYIFVTETGEEIIDGEKERIVELNRIEDVVVFDTWNHAGAYENVFYTAPFRKVFFPDYKTEIKDSSESFTHIFKVKASLLAAGECVCLLGNAKSFAAWNTEQPLLLHRENNWWSIKLDLSSEHFPISYKYGVYNHQEAKFICYEDGDNRILHAEGSVNTRTIMHDGFIHLPNNAWKGAGVAIPVFSLRSKKSFGIGEFSDIKLLVDWASQIGLRLIQLLPVNDTSATFTSRDSYPYAAISAFALHPAYINLARVAGKKNEKFISSFLKKQKKLNSLADVDYEKVIQFKMHALHELYDLQENDFLKEEEYKDFFYANHHWLVPYAAFCYLKDKYGTSKFQNWKKHSIFDHREVEKLTSPRSKNFRKIAFWYFVQYHLHLQLKEAVIYANNKGIILKGDIPIGVYRYGCDTWTNPELYNMDQQAGAPPDDFTAIGQNWSFPTYNWKRMQDDNFEWWRRRFQQMSSYFDAFRIDHILGFFRIWSIPINAVQGIMGVFVPAIPVHSNEFGERGIWFDYDRFCKPFITDEILSNALGPNANFVKQTFLNENDS
ncbi:MAG: 4-alpha-glucanotransferase, partial [Chitinophagaceae bacterium]|nr:4-alpha-glucanotransferase [Chitinophagaceae bacterium]